MTLLDAGVMPGKSGGSGSESTVITCMAAGRETANLSRARAIASEIFSRIGVSLEWRDREEAGTEPCAIVITLREDTPRSERPGAIAFTWPYQETANVVVYFDRVRETGWPSLTAPLLAHVFADEIGHVLQSMKRLSATSIMKPRCEYRDYLDSAHQPLEFDFADAALIRMGLERPRRGSWSLASACSS